MRFHDPKNHLFIYLWNFLTWVQDRAGNHGDDEMVFKEMASCSDVLWIIQRSMWLMILLYSPTDSK